MTKTRCERGASAAHPARYARTHPRPRRGWSATRADTDTRYAIRNTEGGQSPYDTYVRIRDTRYGRPPKLVRYAIRTALGTLVFPDSSLVLPIRTALGTFVLPTSSPVLPCTAPLPSCLQSQASKGLRRAGQYEGLQGPGPREYGTVRPPSIRRPP